MHGLQALPAAGVIALAVLAVLLGQGEDSGRPDGGNWLIADRSTLRALPTSGTAWDAMVEVADGGRGPVQLANQESLSAGRTLAAALVHARTGEPGYRDAVVAQLRQVPSSPLGRANVLSVARQMSGWIIAADLVGYRDPTFVSFVSSIRTKYIGNHGRYLDITQTSERAASNWGAWAMASRTAADLYLGDTTDLARAAKVFKGWTGDRSSYAGFTTTPEFDRTWACDPANWVPINPAGCGDRDGALVEDISRSTDSYPTITAKGEMYSWGAFSAAMLTAKLLSRGGYADVYSWSDQALLRAAQFLHRKGLYPPANGINHHVPWMVNSAYRDYPRGPRPAGYGRSFGYADWLSGSVSPGGTAT